MKIMSLFQVKQQSDKAFFSKEKHPPLHAPDEFEKEKLPPERDLFSSIKYLLLIGRLIFLLPCDGLKWESHQKFIFRKNSLPTVICLVIISWCIVKVLVGLKFLLQTSHGGVVGYAHPAHYFLISSILAFIYIYFFLHIGQLKELFISWDNLAVTYDLCVFSLKKVTYFALLPMILPFTINSLFSIDGLHRLDGKERQIPENMTEMEFVYEKLLQHWHSILPFNEFSTVFFALDFVFGSLPRAFVLSMVIVFSYAVSSQFRDIFEKGQEMIKKKRNSDNSVSEEGELQFWIKLVEKHDVLTDFAGEVDSFLSPLIFITYLTSLYLLCMQLLRALSAGTGIAGGDELTVGLSPFIFQASFFVEGFYLYFMSIAAAQVNDYAHKIGHVLRMCPGKYEIKEVARLESRVNSGPRIGFTGGGGCLVITKPFLLTIVNAVITLEIVLLQAQISKPFVAEEAVKTA